MNWRRLHVFFVATALMQQACAPELIKVGQRVGQTSITDTHILVADGSRLPLRVWEPEGNPKAIILALHGFNDYSKAFEIPGTYFSRQNIITYAYDQRGFGANKNAGNWPGAEELGKDMADVTQAIKKMHPTLPLYILGESMGGAVTMTALSRNPMNVEGIVLVAPAVWGRHTMNPLYSLLLTTAAHIIPWAKFSGQGLRIQPSDNHEMLLELGKDPLIIKATRVDAMYGIVNLMDAALVSAPTLEVPSLILYGSKDQIIPKSATWKMLANLGGSFRVVIYPNGYNMLLRDIGGPVVLRDISAWIINRETKLPSRPNPNWRSFFSE